MNNMQVTEPVVTGAPDPDWSGWETWLRGHLDIEREIVIEASGEALGIVSQELRDRISALELKLAELSGAIDILRGLQPPPPAKFQTIRAWSPDTIYHEGAIVAFAGAARYRARTGSAGLGLSCFSRPQLHRARHVQRDRRISPSRRRRSQRRQLRRA